MMAAREVAAALGGRTQADGIYVPLSRPIASQRRSQSIAQRQGRAQWSAAVPLLCWLRIRRDRHRSQGERPALMSKKWSQLGAKRFSEATAGPDTLATVYLNSRGIRLASWPSALRFHPAADHPRLKQKFPALIAKVIGAAEASFQFTYLSADGKGKAAIDKEDQRRTLGSNKGGGVHLTDDSRPARPCSSAKASNPSRAPCRLPACPASPSSVSVASRTSSSPPMSSRLSCLAEDDATLPARRSTRPHPSLAEKGIKVRGRSRPKATATSTTLSIRARKAEARGVSQSPR